MNIQDVIISLRQGRTYFDREEIKAAKRKLSLPRLMKLVGDGAFVSETFTASPFHPTERPTFHLHRRWRRVVFSCCGKCGYAGDQIDYLEARFNFTTGLAIGVFCRLAGIE